MASSHLKRIVAPKTWPIVRKTTTFVTRPKPNGQKMSMTMPVVLVMRELLGLVQSAAQAKTILRTQEVKVNGTRVYDNDSAVGFMDVLTIGGISYRILINQNNVLTIVPLKGAEHNTIQKIANKTSLGKNKMQLNCVSGQNIIVEKDTYKVGDSIAVDFGGKITAHYALAPGACVLLTGGNHIGKVGVVKTIAGNVIDITAGEEHVQTATTHAYVIGKGTPSITLN